ncbi:MAG TPA: 2-hydroxyacid dehydrogenase [Patescibacteria group bacterium]|nr:2-hydroxyacid dehydrogenase [Patescibacteria group bacterium]
MKVLVASKGLARRLSERRDLLPQDVEFVYPEHGTDEEMVALAGDAEVIVSTRLSADVARAAKRLKLLQKTGAGVDAMPFEALGEGVLVANTSGSNPVPLAEGAVALVLALAKKIVARHNAFPQGPSGGPGVELRGKKVGVLGLGSIGTEVARRLKAFEMEVLGIKRNPSEELRAQLDLSYLGGPGDLHKFLSESDFVVVTVPLTPETRGLIGEEELRAMKPTSYLVNVARAGIIQEEPLYRALTEDWIAGAALDVWWVPHWWDPIWVPDGRGASRYPFWELPNVIATPHNIGSSDTRSDASLMVMIENIRRVAEGRPPVNQVDRKLQY